MLLVLLLLFSLTPGIAQNGRDGRPLLREVADASGRLATYRAKGHILYGGDGFLAAGNMELSFDLTLQQPQRMRLAVDTNLDWSTGFPALIVCDGVTGSVYFEKLKQYKKIVAEDRVQYCKVGVITGFEHVADNVKSAVIAGRGQAQFEGRTLECTIVNAEYRVIEDYMLLPGMVSSMGRVKRTMCIDTARRLILRDRLEAEMDSGGSRDLVIETITYDRIERNPNLPAGLFELDLPADAKLFETASSAPTPAPKVSPQPLPPQTRLPRDPSGSTSVFTLPDLPSVPPAAPPSAPHVSLAATSPEPVSRTEPEYSQEAWDEGLMGTVIVLADVDPDGSAHNLRIKKSLGFGLDEKALECVRTWRFKPATQDGRPVKGTAYLTLQFSLPAKRPDKPSNFQVTRPARLSEPSLRAVELQSPTDLDDFFYLVAFNFKAPAVCGKIQPMAQGDTSQNAERGYRIETLQSKCYRNLATALHDPSLCEHVRPVRSGQYDGSKIDRAYCVQGSRGTLQELATPNPHRMDPFVEIMRRAGFGDEEVAQFMYRAPENNPTYEAYRTLLKDPVFLDRVRAGRSYNEARAQARIRAAHPIEFLYEMVAIDTGDAALCDKISPNATYEAFNRTALLRSVCYLHIAFNQKNAPLCDQLPRRGSFPYVKSDWDSLEDCHKTVAIYKGITDRAGGTYGPVSFSRAAQFPPALEQIGYPKSYTESLVPRPSQNDYWMLLQDLSFNAKGAARAEILRRIMALR